MATILENTAAIRASLKTIAATLKVVVEAGAVEAQLVKELQTIKAAIDDIEAQFTVTPDNRDFSWEWTCPHCEDTMTESGPIQGKVVCDSCEQEFLIKLDV